MLFQEKQLLLRPPKSLEEIRQRLKRMNSKKFQDLLRKANIINNLEKDKLIDLILSKQELLGKVELEERKSLLLQKTNQELKSMLQGVENISNLKKIDLVEKILSIEKNLN